MKWIVMLLVLIVVGAVGAYWYEGYSAESVLLKQPVYQILKEHEPAVYEDILEEYKTMQRDEARREDFINFANYQISLAATKHLAHASQESVLALVGDMLTTARTLQKTPGDTCFRYWFPQISGPPDVAKYLDPAAQAHTLDLMGEVIRSAAANPVPLPKPEDVKDNLGNLINGTYAQYGADAQMIAHAEDARVNRTKVCTMTISIYERIMKLPPPQSSALIRAMTQVR